MSSAVSGFASELKRVVEGDVRFDPRSLAVYSTDASNYRQVPSEWFARAMSRM